MHNMIALQEIIPLYGQVGEAVLRLGLGLLPALVNRACCGRLVRMDPLERPIVG